MDKPNADFAYFLPFGKVEKNDDGSRTISGYASTPTLDLDGEIVSLKAIKKALPSYMEWRNIRQMHQPHPVGTAKEANVDGTGLFLTARIVEPTCCKLIDEEVLKGFSIGGKKLAKQGNTITDIDLVEISVVDRPANPDCRFAVAKAAKGSAAIGWDPAFELGAVTEGDGEVGFLRRIVSDVIGKALGLGNGNGLSAIESLPILKNAGKVYGDEAYIDLCKREFSDKERATAADSGEAMPDGSYPIKTEQDVKNAVQAHGRAKDKEAAKKHIVQRAKALKATQHLPADWEGSTKEKKAAVTPDLLKVFKSDPEFYGLTAADIEAMEKDAGTHENGLALIVVPDTFEVPLLGSFLKAGGSTDVLAIEIPDDMSDRMQKGMGTVADLSYAFSSIRDAQRRLIGEGMIEQDGDDAAMARKLGEIASELAAVIGLKATHEGSEAKFMTDADDLTHYLLRQEGAFFMSAENTDLNKRAAAAAVKEHMGKAAGHLQKAGKFTADGLTNLKKAAAGFAQFGKAGKTEPKDMAECMKMLKAAGEAFGEAADHQEMAHTSMTKVTGWMGLKNGTLSETPDTTMISEEQIQEGQVPWYSATEPYPGKAAPAGNLTKGAPEGFISKREADLMVENARLAAVNETLGKMPGGPHRARSFVPDATMFANGAGSVDQPLAKLMDGVKAPDIDDPQSFTDAASKMITNMVQHSMGRSVMDPGFRGGAGK
jgi:phage head maturation protease